RLSCLRNQGGEGALVADDLEVIGPEQSSANRDAASRVGKPIVGSSARMLQAAEIVENDGDAQVAGAEVALEEGERALVRARTAGVPTRVFADDADGVEDGRDLRRSRACAPRRADEGTS